MGKIEKICGIYCISNSKYFYIGQAVDIYRRWSKHRWELRKNIHKNQIMQNVYNKYLEDDPFEFTLVKECLEIELNKYETEFVIEYYYKFPDKRCMNIAPTGKGYAANTEIRNKISTSMTGRSLSEETKAKMSKSRKGQKHEWSRKKMAQLDLEGNLIKVWDSIKDAEKELNIRYHKKNITCGGFQWQLYDEWLTNPKGKVQHKHNITDTVKQYNLQGSLLNEWKSPKEAAEGTNTSPSALSACLNGKGKTAGGFLWSYGECPIVKIADKYITPKKKVEQYSISGELIKIHNTINAAMTKTGITAHEIKKNIEGKINNAGGFIWKYQK